MKTTEELARSIGLWAVPMELKPHDSQTFNRLLEKFAELVRQETLAGLEKR